MNAAADYGDEHIRTLDWKEHIRRRPGMYIGKLGDGTSADDGIYILIKEVLDNSIDEYMMGFGKTIDVTVGDDGRVSVRDYGRGIPLGKLVDVASKMNTGAKYDSKAFKKSVGLNGVGIKAVNALSSEFTIRSVRDGEARTVRFEAGEEISDTSESGVGDRNGTSVSFVADRSVFGEYAYHMEYVETMIRNYTYLNAGLTIRVNGQAFVSRNGLLDLLNENLGEELTFDGHFDQCREIFRALIESGCGIECNTNRGHQPLPDAPLLKLYREQGGEIITLGSDAHSAEYVGCCIRERQELLRQCGFRYFTTFEGGKPRFRKL